MSIANWTIEKFKRENFQSDLIENLNFKSLDRLIFN